MREKPRNPVSVTKTITLYPTDAYSEWEPQQAATE